MHKHWIGSRVNVGAIKCTLPVKKFVKMIFSNIKKELVVHKNWNSFCQLPIFNLYLKFAYSNPKSCIYIHRITRNLDSSLFHCPDCLWNNIYLVVFRAIPDACTLKLSVYLFPHSSVKSCIVNISNIIFKPIKFIESEYANYILHNLVNGHIRNEQMYSGENTLAILLIGLNGI